MKLFNKIAIAAIGAFMAIGGGVAAGVKANAKTVYADGSYTFTALSGTDPDGYWSYSTAKNSGSSNPAMNSSQLRLYAKNSITFTFDDYTLVESLTFNCVVNANSKGVTPTGYTPTNGTVTAFSSSMTSFVADNFTASTFTLTVDGSAGNLGLYSVVTVTKGAAPTYDLESIAVADIVVAKGQTASANVTYTPSNATDKAVTYQITSGSDKASVDSNGVVTGLLEGNAVLTVTPHDTHAAATTCNITVLGSATTVTLDVGTNGNTTWANGVSTPSATVDGVTFTATKTDGNDSKYYSTDTSWRFYTSGQGVLVTTPDGTKISSVKFTFNKGNFLTPSDFTADGSTSPVTFTPKTTTDTNQVVIARDSSNLQIQEIEVSYVTSTKPSVKFTSAPSSLEVGATGTLTATSVNATSPTYSYSSSDSTVISVNSSTGAYEALKAGAVTLTVSMTCTEGAATATTSVKVNTGLITVAQANTIAAGLSSGEETAYKVTIQGYITSLNPDGKASDKLDALNISAGKVGSEGSTIMAYGIYTGTTSIRNYAILNGTIKVTANIKNYSGTIELTNIAIDEYTDDAMTFAKNSYESLDTACVNGAGAVTNEQWTALGVSFNALDEYAKAKLVAAGSDYAYSEDIANWIARYTRIVNAGKADFMGKNVASSNNTMSASVTMTIVVAATAAITLVGAYFLLRKKKLAK